MKIFIKKIFIFSLFFFFILVIKKALTPYHWGNKMFSKKVTYFQSKPSNFNTIFFGSSRIYRHINPIVLDSILKEKDIHSFNFASPATFNPESYFLYENFIDHLEENQIKYALLEIQQLNLHSKNTTTTKGSYWNTIPILKYSIESIISSKRSVIKKVYYTSVYLESFLYSLFDFKILKPELQEKPKGIHGFYPLEEESHKKYKERWDDFHSDTTQIQASIRCAVNQDFYLKENKKVNVGHFKKLNSLLLKSKRKGIHLFFLIPPKLEKISYSELVPLLNSIPKEHTLSLYEYQKFTDLYFVENAFDIGHFNTIGANLFTTYVANMIKEKLDTNTEQSRRSQ